MKKIFTLFLFLPIALGCKKNFLDVKPNDALVVPTTLKDFQALLDNEDFMNGFRNGGPNPSLIFAGSDEYYITDNLYNTAISQHIRNAYVWENNNLFSGLTAVLDWASPYRTVYYANTVLDGLKKIDENTSNSNDYQNIKGSALFYRAYAFYQLAQAFSQPYNTVSAKTDLGIPIRLAADVSEKSSRATVEQTYAQIKNDLEQALPLLPDKPLFNTRPSKPAGYALLARMYLGMENYDEALKNAESCLLISSDLLDYNTINANSAAPIPATLTNKEVLLGGTVQSQILGAQLFNPALAMIDSTLYPLYADDDIRKKAFFKSGPNPNSVQFKGTYATRSLVFAGIANDEVYLIKAECLARKGDINGSMQSLNDLLIKRWRTGTFTPLTAADADAALRLVLIERRKELLMRGTRWTDLKRLNRDSRFAKTLYRYINGKTFSLPPNDPRYTWQIPDDVLNLNPGMQQNPK